MGDADNNPNIGTAGEFVTEFDGIPNFWQYLLNLEKDDLIPELIQNDLDQGATQTEIRFEKDCLVCEGNGQPVENDGWKRLRIMQGAGDRVPAKRTKIGVKNHGLKTAFTIGDELELMSNGLSIKQTLYSEGRRKPPCPGASREPSDCPQSPATGCRITVQYRKKSVKLRNFEGTFPAVTEKELEDMFKSACKSIPEQFAGIISPGKVSRYEIMLKHWRLGKLRFQFSCKKPNKKPKKIHTKIEIFRRYCRVEGVEGEVLKLELPEDLQEQAVRRRIISVKGCPKQKEVPDHFWVDRGYFIEVSWPINKEGRPKLGTGRFRYPLGYPQNLSMACTSFGAYFNAPFVSDNKRHGPVPDQTRNKALRGACESLLVYAIVHYHKIRSCDSCKHDRLTPLLPRSGMDDDIIRPLLAKLAKRKRGAVPVLGWRDAAKLSFRGSWKKIEKALRRAKLGERSGEALRYRFIVPFMDARPDMTPALSLLCPRSEMQIDPRVHSDIIRLLSDGKTPGFEEGFITFDCGDVFARAAGEDNQYFGAIPDRSREFSEPIMASMYLNVIHVMVKEDKDKLLESLLMPDQNNEAKLLKNMYTSVKLRLYIPGLQLPSILHREVARHPLLKEGPWKRQEYTMTRFIDSKLQLADQETRRQFWGWLCRNKASIGTGELQNLAKIEIWPDRDNNLRRISDLCEPQSQKVCEVLAEFIHRPNQQVLKSGLAKIRGRASTSIKRTPDLDQVVKWLETNLERTVEKGADIDVTDDLARFEEDLAILLQDTTTAPRLKEAREKVSGFCTRLPALAQDGSIQPRKRLVLPNPGNDRLALPKRFLLEKNQNTDILEKLVPTLRVPNAEMLLEAFDEDSGNLESLQARLKSFLATIEPNGDARCPLMQIPIIPVKGKLHKPSTLALAGNRGDYWGQWKTRIPVARLSSDDQKRYLDIGVTSAAPNEETSQKFFRWLAEQKPKVIMQHIPCVLRHILHEKGPASWYKACRNIAFIPVESRYNLKLVTLDTALTEHVFLNDAGDIGKKIIHDDSRVLLIVDHVREVKESATETLKGLGVKSLRIELNSPEEVTGDGNTDRADEDVFDVMDSLLSDKVRETMTKRLSELDISQDAVYTDWHDRLKRIEDIRLADTVKVRHHFLGRDYWLEADAGFDPGSRIFWAKRNGARREALFRSIAKDLFFKPEALKAFHCALSGIPELLIDDPTYGQPSSPQAAPNNDRMEDSYEHDENGQDAEPGEATRGHSPYTPDARRNIPSLGPIPAEVGDCSGSPRRRTSATRSEPTQGKRSTSTLEDKQIDNLKEEQYAYHCQICLCKAQPEQLAPTGSYIEHMEVRRFVIEAHHVDSVAGGGARHAKNIIILCKHCHNNYGRQLSRLRMAAVLRDSSEERTLNFDGKQVKGRKIKYRIESSGELLEIFFSEAHACMWLS